MRKCRNCGELKNENTLLCSNCGSVETKAEKNMSYPVLITIGFFVVMAISYVTLSDAKTPSVTTESIKKTEVVKVANHNVTLDDTKESTLINKPIKTKRPPESSTYYVAIPTLNVRLSPSSNGKLTEKLHKNEKVKVYETNNGWARVSPYYLSDVQGLSQNVAKWVFTKYLTKKM